MYAKNKEKILKFSDSVETSKGLEIHKYSPYINSRRNQCTIKFCFLYSLLVYVYIFVSLILIFSIIQTLDYPDYLLKSRPVWIIKVQLYNVYESTLYQKAQTVISIQRSHWLSLLVIWIWAFCMREYRDTYSGSVISEAIRDVEVDNTTGKTSHYIYSFQTVVWVLFTSLQIN